MHRVGYLLSTYSIQASKYLPGRQASVFLPIKLRNIFPQELPLLLAAGGLHLRSRFGDLDGNTFGSSGRLQVFLNKAKCDACHEGINFSSNSFNNLGVGMDKPDPDTGRYVVTKKDEDWGKFKTPTLRDIGKTAPYMHDGSLKTLEEVVDFYDKGGIPNRNLDEKIIKLNLTAAEKKDLVEFLKALDGQPVALAVPTDFPQ